VATIALLQQRSRHRASQLAEQLQGALNSRVVIEQAKGVLADYAGLDMEAAYQALRRYSRDHNAKLSELAREVVQRAVSLDAVVAALRS
jgi:AmiR/NasT family two-component response regulator